MKWRNWLKQWDINSIKLNLKFLEMDFSPKEADKDAAWELYVELLTRISTQDLHKEHGDEEAALKSIHSFFEITREILKTNKRDCQEFAKIAIPMLNQVIRPFTAKWHKLSSSGAFQDVQYCHEFRSELTDLQKELRKLTRMIGAMSEVEDFTVLEAYEEEPH